MSDSAEQLYERLLILRCQTGDEAAFAELVARYSPRIGYYLRKMLGDLQQAEDALQDVWFDVFRKVPRLARPEAFAPWLYRVARDRAYRTLRRSRRTLEPLREDEIADPSMNGDTFSAEDAAFIHAALDRLAPEHREVLVLRFLEELSYEDIAAIVDSPLGTVRSRLHYAKRALRRALEKDQPS
jgi:RNA polymerase sigma-70 factor (ECF subfamily)